MSASDVSVERGEGKEGRLATNSVQHKAPAEKKET
jgi:hypothetical protein